MSFVVKIEGEVGTGKSSFALTLPKPLVHISTDVGGFERAAWRFKGEIASGAVRSKSFFIPQQAIIDKLRSMTRQSGKVVGMKELWYERLLPWYIAALQDDAVKTIVFDSWTQTWPLCTNTVLEELQEKNPGRSRLQEIEYTEPNLRMSALTDAAVEMGKNLVLISHMTDERRDYVDTSTGKKESILTGKRTADCWKRTDRIVDIIVSMELKENKPVACIKQSKVVLDLTGMSFENPCWESVEGAMKMLRGEG